MYTTPFAPQTLGKVAQHLLETFAELSLNSFPRPSPRLTIGPPEKEKFGTEGFGRSWGLFSIGWSGLNSVCILRAPKSKHIKEALPDNGQTLKKRKPKHIAEGLFTKVSPTLGARRVEHQKLSIM